MCATLGLRWSFQAVCSLTTLRACERVQVVALCNGLVGRVPCGGRQAVHAHPRPISLSTPAGRFDWDPVGEVGVAHITLRHLYGQKAVLKQKVQKREVACHARGSVKCTTYTKTFLAHLWAKKGCFAFQQLQVPETNDQDPLLSCCYAECDTDLSSSLESCIRRLRGHCKLPLPWLQSTCGTLPVHTHGCPALMI